MSGVRSWGVRPSRRFHEGKVKKHAEGTPKYLKTYDSYGIFDQCFQSIGPAPASKS